MARDESEASREMVALVPLAASVVTHNDARKAFGIKHVILGIPSV